MKSEHETEDVKDATKAFKSRIAKFLLDAKPGSDPTSIQIDARTAILLQKNDVFRQIVPIPMSDIDPAVVSDPSHPNRVRFGEGPLLFVQEPKAQHRSVIKVSGLLFSSTATLRTAAMKFLHLLGTEHNALAARSMKHLEQLLPEVSSDDRGRWQEAALTANEIVENDWLCNLAGARQSALARFDEGYTDYLSKVIRPSIRSIELIELKVWEPTVNRDVLTKAIEQILENSPSFLEALNAYFREFGHLPLNGSFSASGLFHAWSRRSVPGDINWANLWEWADKTQSPLARYHICQLLAKAPQLIPEGMHSQFWREVVQVVHPAEQQSDPRFQSWLLVCELSRHFCHYLAYLVPGMPGERVANLAWWLSTRVSEIYVPDQAVVKQVRESLADQFDMSSHIWRLVTPPTDPSNLCYGTMWTRSIWSVAMIEQIDGLSDHLAADDISKLGPIANVIKGHLISMFPVKAVEDSTYAFDHTVLATAERWAAASSGEESELLRELVTANRKLGDREFQVKLLASIGMGNDADDVLLANALRAMAYAHTAPAELLWEKLNDDNWRESALIKTCDQALELLVDTVIAVAMIGDDKWHAYLPHFLALTAEKATNDQRRITLFSGVVLSSIATNSNSAIRRLLSGSNRNKFVSDVAEWRRQLTGAIPWGTPWAVARMRSALASLYL
jgi:hypothetical protein